MSGGGVEDMSTGKTPKWESELWSYLSSGDGVNCPLHDDCDIRRSSALCFADYNSKFRSLYDDQSSLYEQDEAVLRTLKISIPERWTPCQIFQLVEALANKYLEKAAVTQPPTSTELIRHLDASQPVEVRFLPLKVYHGAIWKLDDGWVIHINANDAPDRQRVTLFHEVFHILAHYKATPVFRKRGIKMGFFNEMLADYFAGCILMPKVWVEKKWAEVKDVRRMAEIFRVTELAMWIRLKTMGLTE